MPLFNKTPRTTLPPFEVKHVISTLSQTKGWGITQLNVPKTWTVTKGKGIRVLVIDTGFSDHPDLIEGMDQAASQSFIQREDIHDYNGHSCVSPDTYIHTSLFGIEKIESLYNKISVVPEISLDEDGFEVETKSVSGVGLYTHSIDSTGTNNVNKITKMYKSVVSGDVYKIELERGLDILLTPWHKVPVRRGNDVVKVRADELTVDDSLLFPSTAKELNKEYQLVYSNNYHECENCGRIVTRKTIRPFDKIQCRGCNKIRWKEGTFVDVFNEDLAYLTGVIITDGHINRSRGVFCVEINNNEKSILEKCSEISERLGFGSGHIYKSNTRAKINVLKIGSKRLVGVLNAIGVLSHRKTYDQTLPTIVSISPLSVIYSFLAGMIDGDGCISSCNTRNSITTINKEMAYQLCYLFNSIGIRSGVQTNKNIGFHGESTTYPFIYQTRFGAVTPEISLHLAHHKKIERSKITPEYTRSIRKIKTIEKTQYHGHFYDFTVENDNTYIANGHFVSNTHCLGIIGARDNDIGMVGVAPECTMYTAKALARDGSGSMKALEDALAYAIFTKPDVVSMSLGAPVGTPKIHEYIKTLYRMNIPVICAAGNSGRHNDVNYPAAYPETIAVTAFDKDGNPARFNSTGGQVDFSAPGVDIYSTWINHQYVSISGTCLAGDTKIHTINGWKYIKDMEAGDEVFSINTSTLQKEVHPVTDVLSNGVKKTYKIKTRRSEVVATDNHPFLVGVGYTGDTAIQWKEVKDLQVGDSIILAKTLDHTNKDALDLVNKTMEYKHIEMSNRLKASCGVPLQTIKCTPEFCQFIGAYLGDGYINTNAKNDTGMQGVGLCVRYGYKQKNKKMPDQYKELIYKATGLEMTIRPNGDLFVYSEYFANILESLGLFKDVYTKRIPEWVFGLPREYRVAMLSGIIDSDGWFGATGSFGLELCNKLLLEDVRSLLLSVGIRTSPVKRREKETSFSAGLSLPIYSIQSSSIKAIESELTFFDKCYREFLDNKCENLTKNEKYMSEFRKTLENEGFTIETISEISEEGEQEVFDITVEGSHNFIANGVVVHNSMATPFIAGLVALLLSKHKIQEESTGKNDCRTVEEIREHLVKYADDKGVVGKDPTWGYGVIDPTKMIEAQSEQGTPAPNFPIEVVEPGKISWWKRFVKWLKKGW